MLSSESDNEKKIKKVELTDEEKELVELLTEKYNEIAVKL